MPCTLGSQVKRSHGIFFEECSGESDYSLPCLSSEEDTDDTELHVTPRPSRNLDMLRPMTSGSFEDMQNRSQSLELLLPRPSPLGAAKTVGVSLTIRPFPLLTFMESPEFSFLLDIPETDEEGSTVLTIHSPPTYPYFLFCRPQPWAQPHRSMLSQLITKVGTCHTIAPIMILMLLKMTLHRSTRNRFVRGVMIHSQPIPLSISVPSWIQVESVPLQILPF